MKIVGKMVDGMKKGRLIGFPTLNLPYSGEEIGVFVGEVEILGGEFSGHKFQSAVNVGPKPTFGVAEKFCEAFLLDFDGDVSEGTEISVELFEKIRDVKKFENVEELKRQINEDVQFCRNWYNSRK